MVHPPQIYGLTAGREEQSVKIELDRVDGYETVWRARQRLATPPNTEQGVGCLPVRVSEIRDLPSRGGLSWKELLTF